MRSYPNPTSIPDDVIKRISSYLRLIRRTDRRPGLRLWYRPLLPLPAECEVTRRRGYLGADAEKKCTSTFRMATTWWAETNWRGSCRRSGLRLSKCNARCSVAHFFSWRLRN